MSALQEIDTLPFRSISMTGQSHRTQIDHWVYEFYWINDLHYFDLKLTKMFVDFLVK